VLVTGLSIIVVIAIVRLLRAFATRGGIPIPSAVRFGVVCPGLLGLWQRVWQFAQCGTTGLAAGAALSRTPPERARSLRPSRAAMPGCINRHGETGRETL
jgi:hypothetical protein